MSMLVFFLSGLMRLLGDERISISIFLMTLAAFVAQCLLRADRFYSCMLLMAIAFAVKTIRNHGNRKQRLISALLMFLLAISTVKGVNAVTQTPGLNHRVQTDFNFILLDRVVWPNMVANYDSFSEEIRNIITMEEAVVFDSHNNNVMYQMAPLVEQRAGK